jgi:ribonuclease P protein component
VLARANRVVTGDDFKATVRRGKRTATPHALLYVAQREGNVPTRFGFIVSKAVGNAVERNLVTRRLRSVGSELLELRPTGTDVVIRALPGSLEAGWVTLSAEISEGFERMVSKR